MTQQHESAAHWVVIYMHMSHGSFGYVYLAIQLWSTLAYIVSNEICARFSFPSCGLYCSICLLSGLLCSCGMLPFIKMIHNDSSCCQTDILGDRASVDEFRLSYYVCTVLLYFVLLWWYYQFLVDCIICLLLSPGLLHRMANGVIANIPWK